MSIKKILVILTILLLILGVSGILFWQYKNIETLKNEKVQLEQQIANLEETAPVLMTTVDLIKPGDMLKPTDFTTKEVPVSSIPPDAITNPEDLNTLFVKFAMKENTILTKSNMMKDRDFELTYKVDLSLVVPPTTLTVGDYIDIRIKFPMGEDYCVASSVRVYNFNDGVPVVKLDKRELLAYESALKDRQGLNDKACDLYAVKVVEPGKKIATKPNYPIRAELEPIIQADLELVDKELLVQSEIRKSLDTRIAMIRRPEFQELMDKYNNGQIEDITRLTKGYEAYRRLIETQIQESKLAEELARQEAEGSEGE